MVRVKSNFTYIVFETNLLSTCSRVNSLGGRRILTKCEFILILCQKSEVPNMSKPLN